MMYTLGIDIGTTNVKCVLFGERIRMVEEAAYEYPTLFPRPSWVEQDPEFWWKGVVVTIKTVLSKSGIDPANIRAIAVSCQSPCALLVDKNGTPLHNALIWMDRRSTEEVKLLDQLVGANRIFEITGNRLDTYFMLPKLMWMLRNHPELIDKTYKVLQANGYVNLKLTGVFSIDYSSISLTQLYDMKNKCWSKEIFDAIGMDSSIMPDIYGCTEVIGGVSEKAAEITGLKPGTPVLGGTVDGTASTLEVGLKDGEAVEMTGTSSVLNIGVTEPVTSMNLSYLNGINEKSAVLFGAMSSTGGCLRWFRDYLYNGKINKNNAYQLMDAEVMKEAPEPSKLIFLPYMAGERAPIWDPNARGVFFGLNMGTSRAQLLRAIMEGACFALRDNLEEAEKLGMNPKKFYVTGGCSNSDIWLKIKASVINREIIVPYKTLGAPGGLACMIAEYTGEYDSAQSAAEDYLKIAKIVKPEKSWIAVYDELYALYKSVYGSLKDEFVKLSKLH